MDRSELEERLVALLPALRGYARALTREGPYAEDLVQETVARAIARAGQFTPGTNFRSWVLRIERNLWFGEFNRQRRERPGYDLDVHPGCQAPDQDWTLHRREVGAALARLKPAQRDLLVAVALDGTSYDEAARRADVSIGTIKSRLFRARAALADSLEGRSGAAGETAPGTADLGRGLGPPPWHGWQTTML